MITEKPFYLLRHGESEANAAEICAGGGYDSPLNQVGIAQAQQLADTIHHLEIKPEVIHHSTMIRAHKTAEIVNSALNLDMNAWRDLREHDLGDWEGASWEETFPKFAAEIPPPNGEDYKTFGTRVQKIFMHILDTEERLPLIVCHGGVFHALTRLYSHAAPKVQNCHIHLFEPAPHIAKFPWRVTAFDDDGDVLSSRPADFCLYHTALSDMA